MRFQHSSLTYWFPIFSVGLGFAGLAIMLVVSKVEAVPFGYLTRDPATAMGGRSYAGFLSNLGVLYWMASAAVTAFGAALVGEAARGVRSTKLLIALTILSSALCLDDLFLIHERFPYDEIYLFAGYAVFLVVTAVVYRDLFDRRPTAFLTVAGLFFIASIGVDQAQAVIEEQIGEYRILLEDGAKFLGAVFWLNFSWSLSAEQVSIARPVE